MPSLLSAFLLTLAVYWTIEQQFITKDLPFLSCCVPFLHMHMPVYCILRKVSCLQSQFLAIKTKSSPLHSNGIFSHVQGLSGSSNNAQGLYSVCDKFESRPDTGYSGWDSSRFSSGLAGKCLHGRFFAVHHHHHSLYSIDIESIVK
jgi:hypothetical protein